MLTMAMAMVVVVLLLLFHHHSAAREYRLCEKYFHFKLLSGVNYKR